MTSIDRDPSAEWEVVMEAYAEALEAAGISSLTICSDDYGMETADDENLVLWVDDLEARVIGPRHEMDVMRMAMHGFMDWRNAKAA